MIAQARNHETPEGAHADRIPSGAIRSLRLLAVRQTAPHRPGGALPHAPRLARRPTLCAPGRRPPPRPCSPIRQRAFLASATPAAGKTTFGLHVAHRMLSEGRVARVCVVAPTTHICRQWAADAARYGIDLEPNRPNAAGPEPRDRHGVAVTYAARSPPGRASTAAAAPRRPTLLIADEPHHMGEQAAWGRSRAGRLRRRAASACCSPARRSAPTTRRSRGSPTTTTASPSADYAYGYTRRAARRRLPPGHLPHLRRRHGVDERRPPPPAPTSRSCLPAAEAARRLRTALDPDGDWIGHVLRDADARLVDLRAGAHPDAGGLVVAIDKEHAGAARRPARAREPASRRRSSPPTTAGASAADRALRRGLRARGSSRC